LRHRKPVQKLYMTKHKNWGAFPCQEKTKTIAAQKAPINDRAFIE